MKAMVIEAFGDADVLHSGELPRPEPRPGEVVVEVAYAGVNPADWKTRKGMLSKYIDYRFPFVLGFDLAGTVAAVGESVDTLRIGDRVFGTSMQGQGENGSYAEYSRASVPMLARVPETISLAEAGGLATAGTTAYGGLVDVGALQAGKTVLINGGAGGVGSIGIQIARAMGARVATTCSARNIEYVKSLGAECAIDYNASNVVEAVQEWTSGGVDLVLDAVGLSSLLSHATELVKPGGRYVEIETLISEASEVEKQAGANSGVQIVSNMTAIQRLPEHLAGLARLIADGKIRPPVTEIMPLEDAAETHRRVEAGHVRGKIVLAVSPQ